MFDLAKGYEIISCHEQWDNTKYKSQHRYIDITSISIGNERVIKTITSMVCLRCRLEKKLVIVECKLPFLYNIVVKKLQQSRQDGDDRVSIL